MAAEAVNAGLSKLGMLNVSSNGMYALSNIARLEIKVHEYLVARTVKVSN